VRKSAGPTKRRKFTLIDAIVLIAATAIGLVPIRYAYASGFFSVSAEVSAYEWYWLFAVGSYPVVVPILVAWSFALCALRLLQPRPRLRRLFRQPGMAATSAILLTLLLTVLKLCGSCGLNNLIYDQIIKTSDERIVFETLYVVTSTQLSALCDTVLAIWMVLSLARFWRPEPSWIDRAGRALGILSLVYGLLIGCMSLVD